MANIKFDQAILENNQKLLEQLNLLSLDVDNALSRDGLTRSEILKILVELNVIQRQPGRPGAIGVPEAILPGPPSTIYAVDVTQHTLNMGGLVTVLFDGNFELTSYFPHGFVLTSDGEVGYAVPQIPPLTDTRRTDSVQFRVFDVGTLWVIIKPFGISYFKDITQEILNAGGLVSIEFNQGMENSIYIPWGMVLNSLGEIGPAVPQIPPLADSRTHYSATFRVFDIGRLWAVIHASRFCYTMSITQAVLDAGGLVTIPFSQEQETSNYIPEGLVLTSGGEVGYAIPQIPPLFDTRSKFSIQFRVFDVGRLWVALNF